jgi:hypothetical protein
METTSTSDVSKIRVMRDDFPTKILPSILGSESEYQVLFEHWLQRR